MFFVWEGNHRTLAWMELISEKYKDSKAWHFRVVSTIIDPSKLSEVTLLAGLLRMNNLNEHAIIKTNLKDVLVNAAHICECDFKIYLKEQTSEVAKTLEAKRKLEAKLPTTWYPLAREDLAQLVYQVEFQREMRLKMFENTSNLSVEERANKEKEIVVDLRRKYNDRMQKVLNIINPSLGKEWREVLFTLQFDSDNIVGIEKLNLLAISSISSERKLHCLRLLESSKSVRTSYGMPSTNSEFRAWLSREVLLDIIEKNAHRILEDERRLASVTPNPIELPGDPTLQSYFATIRKEGKKSIYGSINKKGSKEKNKKKDDGPKQSQLDAAAHRLIYRFLLHLKNLGLISQMPNACKEWIDVSSNETSMYGDMRSLTPYEIENCPWWLDMPFPEVLAREKENFKECSQNKGQTFVINDAARKGKNIMQESIDKVKHTTTQVIEQTKRPSLIDVENTYNEPMNFGVSMSIPHALSHRYVPYVHSNATFPLGREYYSYGIGDYIAMGKDFASSIRNEEYAKMHSFFVELDKGGVKFSKKGKNVAWAADFVFLELPSSTSFSHEEIPSWNILTEDHIRHGIGVAGACLRDSGWLVCLASLSGSALTWLEKYVSRLDLEIVRRFVVENEIYCGEIEVNGIVTQMDAFCMYMIRRKGGLPSMQLVESLQFRLELAIDFGKHIFRHYFPETAKAQEAGDASQIRGMVQLSVAFVRCILESLCPPHGLVVEMGCGTAPLMRACMISGRPCFSFDSDPLVVDQILSPLVERVQVISQDHVSHTDGSESEHEDDGYDNPFD